MKTPKNLLIIRLSALGDVCMTLPVIYLLAEQHPDVTIHVLTRKRFRELFFSRPANVWMIEADLDAYRNFPGKFRLFHLLKQEKIDAVADFHGVLRSYIQDVLFRLRGIPVAVVQKQRSKRKSLTRLTNKRKDYQTSFFVRYARVLEELGLPISLDAPSAFLPVVSRPAVTKGSRPAVGIAPFARYFTKIYPQEQMTELIRLLAENNYQVFLFGNGPKEMAAMQEIKNGLEQVQIVPEKLSFKEQLQLMASLRVMVSMDSANMHLASLVHTPVVSIWGGTTPHCGFLGWKQQEAHAACLNLPCQPCSISGTDSCPLGHFNCMKQLSPETILHLIQQVAD